MRLARKNIESERLRAWGEVAASARKNIGARAAAGVGGEGRRSRRSPIATAFLFLGGLGLGVPASWSISSRGVAGGGCGDRLRLSACCGLRRAQAQAVLRRIL
jgi:hypothetical protein